MTNEDERDSKKRKDDGEDQLANHTSKSMPIVVENYEQSKDKFPFPNLACEVKPTLSLIKILEEKISSTSKSDERSANSEPPKNFFPIFDRKSTPSSTTQPTATYMRGGGRGAKQKKKGLVQLQTRTITEFFKPRPESESNSNKLMGGNIDQS